MKYVIVSGRQKNGGSIALHKLCSELSDMGQDARIFYVGPLCYYPFDSLGHMLANVWFYLYLCVWMILDGMMLAFARCFRFLEFVKNNGIFNGYAYYPIKNCRRKYLPFVDSNTVVVYPDVIYGNPLHARNVVRWQLYYPRYDMNSGAYGKDDVFFFFRALYADHTGILDPQILYLLTFDFDLYKNDNRSDRSGKCYFIRKGKDRNDLPVKYDGPVLDNLSEEKIVESLNRCEYCIFYDTASFYMTIALACGCTVIVVPEPGKTRADYVKQNEAWCGVAFGYDDKEISYARETAHFSIEYLYQMEHDNKAYVLNFVNRCNEKWRQ